MKKRVTEADLLRALATRHQPPAWAFLSHVRNGTGFSRVTRTADALAMSLYPSRGLHLHGFEVKVYRNDWLRELKTPEKAEEIWRYCHFWWVVAASESVVYEEELPPKWGLLIPHGKALRAVVKAQAVEAEPPSYHFLGSILRKTTDVMIPRESIQEQIDAAYESGAKSASFNKDRIQRELDSLKESLQKFEAASGVRISRWSPDPAKTGELFRRFCQSTPELVQQRFKGLRRQVRDLLKVLEEGEAEDGEEDLDA